MVSIEDTIKGFNAILNGEVDDLPEQAFLNVGTIEDAIAKGKEAVADKLTGTIVKEIYVPGRIINIVQK